MAPAFALIPYQVGVGSHGRSISGRRSIMGRNGADEGASTRRRSVSAVGSFGLQTWWIACPSDTMLQHILMELRLIATRDRGTIDGVSTSSLSGSDVPWVDYLSPPFAARKVACNFLFLRASLSTTRLDVQRFNHYPFTNSIFSEGVSQKPGYLPT